MRCENRGSASGNTERSRERERVLVNNALSFQPLTISGEREDSILVERERRKGYCLISDIPPFSESKQSISGTGRGQCSLTYLSHLENPRQGDLIWKGISNPIMNVGGVVQPLLIPHLRNCPFASCRLCCKTTFSSWIDYRPFLGCFSLDIHTINSFPPSIKSTAPNTVTNPLKGVSINLSSCCDYMTNGE